MIKYTSYFISFANSVIIGLKPQIPITTAKADTLDLNMYVS